MTNHPNRSQKDDDRKLPAAATGTALEIVDFGADAGLGTEGLGVADLLTPILSILHYQCPQITRGDPKFVPGAKPSDIYDASTGQCWPGQDVGLDVIVCGVKRTYVEWIPRSEKEWLQAKGGDTPSKQIVRVRSGNFRGFHDPSEPMVLKLLSRYGDRVPLPWINADGETVLLAETGELFVLFAPPPLTHFNAQRAMVNFKATSLKNWRQYNSRHASFKYPQRTGQVTHGPVCEWRWRLRSQPASNENGNFFVWSIELESRMHDPETGALANRVRRQDPELFNMAQKSLEQYLGGQVRYQPEEGGSEPSTSAVVSNSDDPPF